MIVLAVDPGIRSPGAAALGDDGTLIAATRIKVPASTHRLENDGDRVVLVAHLIASWWQSVQPLHRGCAYPFELVYEWPQIYRASRAKGNPNHLLKTLAVGAAVSGMVRATRTITPTPHDWAKNTTKSTEGDPWDSQRAKMVLRRLRAGERELIPDSHDAIDAVALAFWRVGRFEPICVFPGASPG